MNFVDVMRCTIVDQRYVRYKIREMRFWYLRYYRSLWSSIDTRVWQRRLSLNYNFRENLLNEVNDHTDLNSLKKQRNSKRYIVSGCEKKTKFLKKHQHIIHIWENTFQGKEGSGFYWRNVSVCSIFKLAFVIRPWTCKIPVIKSKT